jgi:hypothetical protein
MFMRFMIPSIRGVQTLPAASSTASTTSVTRAAFADGDAAWLWEEMHWFNDHLQRRVR